MIATFLGGLLLSLVILLALVIWSIRRHRDPDLHIEWDAAIPEWMPTLPGLTGGPAIQELMPPLAGLAVGTAVAGNSAAVLENGAFFDALIGRIQAARASVHLETFLWKDGVLGRRVADALINRARAGLKVR